VCVLLIKVDVRATDAEPAPRICTEALLPQATESHVTSVQHFEPDAEDVVLGQCAELQDGLMAISSALSLTAVEGQDLLSICSLEDTDDLSLSNVSKLYRYWIFSKILKVDLSQLRTIARQTNTHLYFESPESTYKMYTTWTSITSDGFSSADVCFFISADTKDQAPYQSTRMQEVSRFVGSYVKGQATKEMLKSAIKDRYPDDPIVKEPMLSFVIEQASTELEAMKKMFLNEKPGNYHKAFLVVKGPIRIKDHIGQWAAMDGNSLE
jgi:hypothetical protein